MSKSVSTISSLIDFSIEKDHVSSRKKQFYFYRFFPPNLSILTSQEKQSEIDTLCTFLEVINMPLQIFAMDKVEDLSKNKDFFKNNMLKEHEEYTQKIIKQLSSYEMADNVTNSIQRAYYFIIEVKNKDEKNIFDEALRTNRIKTKIVLKDELITVFRNFYIREFSSFDLYVFDKEVLENHGRQSKTD